MSNLSTRQPSLKSPLVEGFFFFSGCSCGLAAAFFFLEECFEADSPRILGNGNLVDLNSFHYLLKTELSSKHSVSKYVVMTVFLARCSLSNKGNKNPSVPEV